MDAAIDQKKNRLLWGAALAWVPFAFLFVVMLKEMFRAVSSSKATGIGAIAGGLSEVLVTFGFVCFVAAQIAAIVLLFRSFAPGRTLRNVFVAVSLLCSLSILALLTAAVCLSFYMRR